MNLPNPHENPIRACSVTAHTLAAANRITRSCTLAFFEWGSGFELLSNRAPYPGYAPVT